MIGQFVKGRAYVFVDAANILYDSNFAPLLDAVKARHKRTLVISTKGHISKELLERAKLINLKKLKEFIAYYKNIIK